MKKFTKEETKEAMRIAMKLKKEYSIKLRCKFNEISLSICLKEAYASIIKTKNRIVNIVEKSYTFFRQDEIGKLKNGWNKFYDICKDFGYELKITGQQYYTHKIRCSKSDFNTIKEMIVEI